MRGRVRGILHDCRLPEDPFSRGAFFFRMGRGPVGLRDQSAVVEDPEPPELMDPEEVKKQILFLFF